MRLIVELERSSASNKAIALAASTGRFGNVGIGQNASKASTTIGERRQRGVFGLADGLEVSADQQFDVRVGSGDRAKDLAAARRCLDIANAHLQVTFSVLGTADEGGIQSDRDPRRRCFRTNRGTFANGRAGFQGVATQGLLVLSCADRKQLLQNIRGRSVGLKWPRILGPVAWLEEVCSESH